MAVLAIGAGAIARAQTSGPPQGTVLDFHSMAPVTVPFTGSANPIRGVNGGGAPWAIGHADGTLRSDGTLEINVFGLVLANDPSVPQNLRNTNPNATFIGVVSCMSVDPSGAVNTVNVPTPPFPATPAGDSRIATKVTLPAPCLAPVLFVASATGAWFSVTGQ